MEVENGLQTHCPLQTQGFSTSNVTESECQRIIQAPGDYALVPPGLVPRRGSVPAACVLIQVGQHGPQVFLHEIDGHPFLEPKKRREEKSQGFFGLFGLTATDFL